MCFICIACSNGLERLLPKVNVRWIEENGVCFSYNSCISLNNNFLLLAENAERWKPDHTIHKKHDLHGIASALSNRMSTLRTPSHTNVLPGREGRSTASNFSGSDDHLVNFTHRSRFNYLRASSGIPRNREDPPLMTFATKLEFIILIGWYILGISLRKVESP